MASEAASVARRATDPVATQGSHRIMGAARAAVAAVEVARVEAVRGLAMEEAAGLEAGTAVRGARTREAQPA